VPHTSEVPGFAVGNNGIANLDFDASLSNSVYGGASTVQPPAVNALVAIRY